MNQHEHIDRHNLNIDLHSVDIDLMTLTLSSNDSKFDPWNILPQQDIYLHNLDIYLHNLDIYLHNLIFT